MYRKKQLDTALEYANRGLELSPDYHDIRVLRIRILQNLNRLEEAQLDLNYLLEKEPQFYAAKDIALRQVRFLAGTEQRNLLRQLQSVYPEDLGFSAEEARILFDSNELEASRDIALKLVDAEGLSGDQRYLLNNILRATTKNEAGVFYQYVQFDNNYDRENWHTYIAEFQHNVNKTTLLARITHSDRGFDSGQLFEVDVYPVVNKSLYFFGNLGLSDGTLFPDVRGTATVFYSFAKGFEAEAGGNVLYFNGNGYLTGILGLTHYAGKFYLNLRASVGPVRLDNTLQNYQFNIRYYLRGSDTYAFARLSQGIAPNETILFTQVQENPGLEASFAGGGLNYLLGRHHILRAEAGWLYEDITPETSGNQFLLTVGYRYRF